MFACLEFMLAASVLSRDWLLCRFVAGVQGHKFAVRAPFIVLLRWASGSTQMADGPNARIFIANGWPL